jgi:hypothetical protein
LAGSDVTLMYLIDGTLTILANYGGVGMSATGSGKFARLDVVQRVPECLQWDKFKTMCMHLDRSKTTRLKVTCREI